ncbi:MAG: hypothetical protein CMC88_03195 [Flavobacteriaceae bacterium]|nr:hypothetical protein [Flavobacteriaceae bacterium]|tara:strand:+ start:661 stop:1044 length:384 start_codon:yes stop_codon:yes gene_type:complete
MSKKENLENKEIDSLIKDLNISYSKSKEEIWKEVNSKLNIESMPKRNQKTDNIFQLNWKFSMAASILIIIGVSWFFNNQQNIMDNQQLNDFESINIENSSIVETLFIEEGQIDEYISLYVINEVIDE